VPSGDHNVQIPEITHPFVLNGSWVAAFEWEGYAVDKLRYVFFSKNVPTGAMRRCTIGLDESFGTQPPWAAPLLAPDGNFAWVRNGELNICLPSGRQTLSNPGVAVSSVTLQGRELSWSDAEGEHSLTL
jgi:hypothetical protein